MPVLPHIIVPRKRRVSPQRRTLVTLHRADLLTEEFSGVATNPDVTLLHRLRALPDDEALAIANPFESVLRAIALTVPGLRVEPQLLIHAEHIYARPDLVDPVRRWRVLRFSWEQVMFRPDDAVHDVVSRVAANRDTRTEVPPVWPRTA